MGYYFLGIMKKKNLMYDVKSALVCYVQVLT
jgi:hypothetical protein